MFGLDHNATGNSGCYALTNNGLSILKKTGGKTWTNGHIYATTSFSSGTLYYEVKIDFINQDGSGFVVGLSTSNRGTTLFKNDLAIGMSGLAYNCNATQHGNKAKTGDIIGVFADFGKNKCHFFFNGTQLSVSADLIPGKAYFPVFHLYYAQDAFTVSFPINIPTIQQMAPPTNMTPPIVPKTSPMTIKPLWSWNVNGSGNASCFSLLNNGLNVTKVSGQNGWDDAMVYGTLPVTFGTHYWEIVVNNLNQDPTGFAIGMANNNSGLNKIGGDLCVDLSGLTYNLLGGDPKITSKKGDVFGLLADVANGKLWFFHNGKQLCCFGNLIKNVFYYPVVHLYYVGDAMTLRLGSPPPKVIVPVQNTISWNTNALGYGSCFTLSNGGSTITKTSGLDQWLDAPIYGSQPFSQGVQSFSIRIESIKEDHSGFVVGVANNNSGLTDYAKDMAIGMAGDIYPTYASHKTIAVAGDVISVTLDFNAGTIVFTHNDILIPTHEANHVIVPGQVYYPVVHLYYIGDSFSVLKSNPLVKPIIKESQVGMGTPLFAIAKVNTQIFTLSNGGFSVKKFAGKNQWVGAQIYGTNSYSSGKVYWEVKLDNCNKDGSGFVIGLSKSNQGVSQMRDDHGIGMSGIGYNTNLPSHPLKGKNNDVFGFSLDFDAGICEIYMNGVISDVSFPIVNGISYWPVVHLYYVNDGFTFQFPSVTPFKTNSIKPTVNTKFQWNTNAIGQSGCFTLTNDGTSVKKVSGGNTWKNAMVYGNTSYSSGRVTYELCIDSINIDGSGYCVGISKSNQGYTQFSGDMTIGFAGSSYNLSGSQHGKKAKSGDIVVIDLDFEQGKASFWFNGTELNCWAPIIKGTPYWPVLHLYYTGDACTLVDHSKSEISSDSLWHWNLLDDKTASFSGHGGVMYKDEMYYIFGDENNQLSSKIYSIHKKTCEKKFITPLNSPMPRRQFSFDIYKNTVYIFGGHTVNGSTNEFYGLNLDTMKWAPIWTDASPPQRCYHSCTVVNDRFYIFGGLSGENHLNDLWYFDFEKQTWTLCKPQDGEVPKPRRYCTLNSYKKKLFLFSGRDDQSRFNDIWEYHIDKNVWKYIQVSGEKIPKPMSAHTAVMFRQCLFVFGGNDGGNTLPNALYRYNTVTNEWRAINTTGITPEGRYWHVAIVDQMQGEMFVHGGMGINLATTTFFKIKIE